MTKTLQCVIYRGHQPKGSVIIRLVTFPFSSHSSPLVSSISSSVKNTSYHLLRRFILLVVPLCGRSILAHYTRRNIMAQSGWKTTGTIVSQVGRADASLTMRINYDINVDLSQSVRTMHEPWFHGKQCYVNTGQIPGINSEPDQARPAGGGSVHWRANGRHIVLKAQVNTYTSICIYTCQLSANID